MTTSTMYVNAYFRAYNRDPERMFSPANVRFVRVRVPRDATPMDMLAAAHSAGAPEGTHQSGVYQLETPHGVWSRADRMRLDFTTLRRADKVQYWTWEELQWTGRDHAAYG